jgi:hypothetical protein
MRENDPSRCRRASRCGLPGASAQRREGERISFHRDLDRRVVDLLPRRRSARYWGMCRKRSLPFFAPVDELKPTDKRGYSLLA